LTGNAPLLAQEYNQIARERGEPQLDIWDRDELLGRLTGNPDAVLRGSVDGQLLSLLGAIEERAVDIDTIETFSRRWVSWEPERILGLGIVEAALVCERLRVTDRLDLACHLGLCCVRAACLVVEPDKRNTVSLAAGSLFDAYGDLLWEECDERLLTENGLVGYSGRSAWVTYPLRAMRVLELISLLALRRSATERDESNRMFEWLAAFAESQPGSARVMGDRYAVSLIPAALALAKHSISTAEQYLKAAAIWLLDRYDRGELGLAGVDAEASEEIARVLGGSFDFTTYNRRHSSIAAAVLLDLSALLGLKDLYADIRNDGQAVDLNPQVLLLDDGPDKFIRTGLTNRWDNSVDYAEELEEEPAAPHLSAAATEMEDDDAWDLLAASSALRDRYYVGAIRAFAPSKGPPSEDAAQGTN
jgi:hypothetical protein